MSITVTNTQSLKSQKCSTDAVEGLRKPSKLAPVRICARFQRNSREIYGQSSTPEDGTTSNGSPPPVPCVEVPQLKPEFFQSYFFKNLLLQRTCHKFESPQSLTTTIGPILDAAEISTRYAKDFTDNDGSLGIEGKLIANVLMLWAMSFGLDGSGQPLPLSVETAGEVGSRSQTTRKEICNKALLDIFQYIDHHGILRRATWDGVRALLLLFPLTEGSYIRSEALLPL